MHKRFVRQIALLVVLLVVVGLSFVDAGAQTRKKRRTRRAPRPVITNPVINPDEQSSASDPKIISTADESETPQAEATKSRKKKTTAADDEDMQQTINALSNQVNRLTDKLGKMQDNERTLLDMERLTRAEQRAESLRGQQLDVETKLADLQSKLDQVDYALKPENIERVTSGYGTTRPEEARDSRRRQLESEKSRLLAQVKILETSRTRLEVAVANADAEVEMLRRRQQQQDAVAPAPTPETAPVTSPKPE